MKISLFALLASFSLLSFSAQAQETLRVNGANAIWAPLNKGIAALEAATGSKIAFVPNTAGRGLADLAEGKCDIAMVTSSLASAADGANQEKAGAVPDLSVFKSTEIGTESIVFIVNKANTTPKLSDAQIADILTGKIVNWKEVGGPDMPITLVRLGLTAGPHMAIEKEILKGVSIPATAKMIKSPKDVPNVVSQVPGAIGYIGANNFADSVKVLETTQPLKMAMFLVTKGATTPVQQKFIDAAKGLVVSK